MRLAPVALLLALLLAVAACSSDPGPAGEDAAASPGAAETEPGADPDAEALDEGVAATVNGTDIPSQEIDNRLAAAGDDPQFAEALEGEEGELMAAQFRAQTLSVLVQTQIVLDAAEGMDAHPTDDDIEQTRSEIHEQFGSQEEFEDALNTSGMSRAAFEEQLRSVAALGVVGRMLVEQGEVPEAPEGAEGVDPEELALQQWLGERFAEADVVVDPSYGVWSPETGQVVPQDMMGPPPGLDEAPDDGT